MTQRHIGALLLGVWLICAALLLQGATVRIPPARPSAVRVQAAGVVSTGTGTGTGTGTVATTTYDGMILELLAANYTANADGVDAVWLDTSSNSYNATQSTHAAKGAASGTAVYFDTGDYVRLSATGFFSAFPTNEFCIVAKTSTSVVDGTQRYLWLLHNGSFGNRWVYYWDNGPDGTLPDKKYGVFVDGGGYGVSSLQPDTADTQPQVIGINWSATTASQTFFVDWIGYAQTSTTTQGRSSAATVVDIGGFSGAVYGGINVYGIRVFDRLKTAAEVSSMTW
jgi:hypothetical protein